MVSILESYILYIQVLIKLKRNEGIAELFKKTNKILNKYPNALINTQYYYLKAYHDFKNEKYEDAIKNINVGIKFSNKINFMF